MLNVEPHKPIYFRESHSFNNLESTLIEDACKAISQIVVLVKKIFKHYPYLFYVKFRTTLTASELVQG